MTDVWGGMRQGVNALGNAARMKQSEDQREFQNALALRNEDRTIKAQQHNQKMNKKRLQREGEQIAFNQDMARRSDNRASKTTDANLQLNQLQEKLTNIKMVGQKIQTGQAIMSQVRDENSYQWAKSQMEQLFPGISEKVPANYDPRTIEDGLFGAQKELTELGKIKAKLEADMKLATHKSELDKQKIITEGEQTRKTNKEKPSSKDNRGQIGKAIDDLSSAYGIPKKEAADMFRRDKDKSAKLRAYTAELGTLENDLSLMHDPEKMKAEKTSLRKRLGIDEMFQINNSNNSDQYVDELIDRYLPK